MSSSWSSVKKAAVAAAVLVCGLSSVAAASSSGASGWVMTHTLGLHLRGESLGRAPGTTPVEVSLALPLRNQSQINDVIEARTVLSKAQARARFAPTPATASAVSHYLASRGFTGITVAGDRLLVTGHGTVARAERAFDTTISRYRLDGQTVYANTSAARVPAALSGKVVAVLGLSDVPMGIPNLKVSSRPGSTHAIPQTAGAASPDLTGFTPQAIQHAYQADRMAPATSTETAVLAGGDMTPTINDLRGAEKLWHFPVVPVNVIPDSPYSTNPSNPLTGNLEWSLDTQYSTMMPSSSTGTVKALDIYDVGTFTDSEVARGISMFVSDDRASALSISLGECDILAFLDGAMITSDEQLAMGSTQGQSSFASTGDNGYACPEVASTGVPEGPPGDSWPAVGEYTVGAGGTTLLADSDGNVQNEISWIGSGGGADPWETAAPWTMQANPFGQTWQFANQGGRAIPDAAAVADSTTPVLVYQGTGTTGVGGTSVSSPVIEGLWDRVNDTSGDTFGLAQYDFYALYNKTNPATINSTPAGNVYVPATSPTAVPGFTDIVVGTNGGCVAKPGWDDCSGIGSLLASDMAKALSTLGLPTTTTTTTTSTTSTSSSSSTTTTTTNSSNNSNGGSSGGYSGASSSNSGQGASPNSTSSSGSSSNPSASSNPSSSNAPSKAATTGKQKSKKHTRTRTRARHKARRVKSSRSKSRRTRRR